MKEWENLIIVSNAEIDALIERVETRQLQEEDNKLISSLLRLIQVLISMIESKNVSIARIKSLIFGSRSEKSNIIHNQKSHSKTTQQPSNELSNVGLMSESNQSKSAIENENGSTSINSVDKPSRKPGHGRLAAEDYPSAKVVYCPNSKLNVGDDSPNALCSVSCSSLTTNKTCWSKVNFVSLAIITYFFD